MLSHLKKLNEILGLARCIDLIQIEENIKVDLEDISIFHCFNKQREVENSTEKGFDAGVPMPLDANGEIKAEIALAQQNEINAIYCDDPNATHTLSVVGQTINNGKKSNFFEQTITLDGKKIIDLNTPLHHILSIENKSQEDLTTQIFAIDKSVGLPTNLKWADTDKVFFVSKENDNLVQNKSMNTIFSVPDGRFAVFKKIYINYLGLNQALAKINGQLQIKKHNSVFLDRFSVSNSNSSFFYKNIEYPYLYAEPNSLVKIRGEIIKADSIEIEAGYTVILLKGKD